MRRRSSTGSGSSPASDRAARAADPEQAVRDRARGRRASSFRTTSPRRFRASRPATDQDRRRQLAQRGAADHRARAPAAAALQRRDRQPAADCSRRESGRRSTPLQLEEVEVSTAQQRAAQVLGFIPMFIILAAFVGGMQIATDSTAGERERGSLEPLLVNPAPRGRSSPASASRRHSWPWRRSC